MKTLTYPSYTYCLLLCLQAVSQADELPKANNNTALNLPGSWSGGAVPGALDVMVWDNKIPDTLPLATALPSIGGDLSVRGLKVTNVGGTLNQVVRFVGIQDPAVSPNPASFYTLTLGTSGIDMSAATQAFLIQSKISIGADQTWNIANANVNTSTTNGGPMGFNNNEDLAFQALAASTPMNFGAHTVTTSGVGQVTITGGYTLSNGTLTVGNNLFVVQGGNSRTTSTAATLTANVNAGTLRFQSNSAGFSGLGPVNVSGGILEIYPNNATNTVVQTGLVTLNSGSTLFFNNNSAANNSVAAVKIDGDTTIRVSGGGMTNVANFSSVTGNITGSANITYQNTATATSGFLRFTGNNSGYSGTITLNGSTGNRSLRLNAADSGSAAATWNVGTGNILQVNGVGVQLGNLRGSGTVTNSGAAAATITVGTGEFSGAVTNGTQPTAVTKIGSGLLRLTGSNTYTGATTVSAGTLVATPDQTGVTAVTVADAAAYGVLHEGITNTLTTGNLIVGATTGGTLQLDFGTTTNPLSPLLSTGTLRFNGTSTVKVSGGNLTPGTFPIIQYGSYDPASTPVNGLTLVLPPRTTGSLINTGTGIDLNIATAEKIKWNGNLSDNWDIDPDGSGGSGTANWRTTVTNASTRYIQGPGGTDSVNFDDSAGGTGTVNLTTTLAPAALVVNNTAKNYTFTGSGKITGLTGLLKSGTGILTLGNTTANDYSGGTVIEAGTLRLGDGVTPGAGQITGNIENSGTLVFNRPDDHNFSSPLTGAGSLVKAQANTLTFTTTPTLNVPLAINGGKVRFAAGGVLSDVVSGSGQLEAAGGTLDISGNSPNTHTGMTTVSAGTLRLGKTASMNSVGGDITITGTGVLNILAEEQIPNTATLYVSGSSADSVPGTPGKETFANAVVSGSSAATQLILRSDATITNTATVNQGVLGVASNNTAHVNAVVMTSNTAILRMAASTNPSTLNVGAGGITASAGAVEVKINTNNFDGILNLSGNVTTTGNFAFTNGGYNGSNYNVVRLNGSRTFDITTGLTTIAPDIADYIDVNSATVPGSLVKTGAGTLVLDASCAAAHSGGTTVDAGTLRVHGTLGGTVQVNPNASIGGSGNLTGTTTVEGAIAPGAAGVPSVGNLRASGSLTFAPGSDYGVELGNWSGFLAGTDWDHLAVNALGFTATPSNKMVIHVSGTPTNFTETNKTITIATSTQPVTGFDISAIEVDATGFTAGTGTWAVQLTGNMLELVYTAGFVPPYDAWAIAEGLTGTNNDPSDDPDQDGQTNLVEFALNSAALSGASSGKVVGKVATVDSQQALTFTLPVRVDVDFTGTTELSGAADGILYRIQASDDFDTWELPVSEVTGPDADTIQSTLPQPLPDGWTYRTFRSPGPVTGDPKEFMRVTIDPAG